MAATLQAIVDGLAARAATVATVSVHKSEPSAINVPAVVIQMPALWTPHHTVGTIGGGALSHYAWPLLLVVSRADEQTGLARLSALLPTVLAAMESDGTLGGAVSAALVMAIRDFGGYTFGGVEYLGAQIEMEIIG